MRWSALVLAAALAAGGEAADDYEDGLTRSGDALGVVVSPLPPSAARLAGVKADNGVLIRRVAVGSPAAMAGLQSGDIILTVDGSRVADPTAFRTALQHGQEAEVWLGVQREARDIEVPASLATWEEIGENKDAIDLDATDRWRDSLWRPTGREAGMLADRMPANHTSAPTRTARPGGGDTDFQVAPAKDASDDPRAGRLPTQDTPTITPSAWRLRVRLRLSSRSPDERPSSTVPVQEQYMTPSY